MVHLVEYECEEGPIKEHEQEPEPFDHTTEIIDISVSDDDSEEEITRDVNKILKCTADIKATVISHGDSARTLRRRARNKKLLKKEGDSHKHKLESFGITVTSNNISLTESQLKECSIRPHPRTRQEAILELALRVHITDNKKACKALIYLLKQFEAVYKYFVLLEADHTMKRASEAAAKEVFNNPRRNSYKSTCIRQWAAQYRKGHKKVSEKSYRSVDYGITL
jgi:hypothetical protein